MKQFSLSTIIALLLLASALPAVAQKPTITEIPFTTPFVVSGGPENGACTFDVLVAPEAGRPSLERQIDFANRSIIVGPLFATLTNESTGKTVNVNISGPSIFNFTGGIPTTIVFMGPTLLAEFPPSLTSAAGLPAVALINGRTVLTFDNQGNLVSLSFTGKVQDVCQMLQ